MTAVSEDTPNIWEWRLRQPQTPPPDWPSMPRLTRRQWRPPRSRSSEQTLEKRGQLDGQPCPMHRAHPTTVGGRWWPFKAASRVWEPMRSTVHWPIALFPDGSETEYVTRN